MDCVRRDAAGIAVEIWPNTAKAALIFHPDVLAHIVEVDSGSVALGDVWNGHGFVSFADPAPTLAQIKAALKAEVDADAERERQRYITGGAGQVLVYEAKGAEVAKWIAAGRPGSVDENDYPWAADRAARRQVAIADVLNEWEQKIAVWRTVGRAIEIAREGAKAAIDAAANEVDARAARAAVSWPA